MKNIKMKQSYFDIYFSQIKKLVLSFIFFPESTHASKVNLYFTVSVNLDLRFRYTAKHIFFACLSCVLEQIKIHLLEKQNNIRYEVWCLKYLSKLSEFILKVKTISVSGVRNNNIYLWPHWSFLFKNELMKEWTNKWLASFW